jgi:hypothetical protein
VPKGEVLTSPQPVKRVFGSSIDPHFRPLESKKPKSPLFFGTFAPLGDRESPDRTDFWAYFPKSRTWSDLAPFPLRCSETVQFVVPKALGPSWWSRRVATHHREEATGQKFVPKGEFLTSPQTGEPGFWVDFRPPFSTFRLEKA